jgi:hypothetical protein
MGLVTTFWPLMTTGAKEFVTQAPLGFHSCGCGSAAKPVPLPQAWVKVRDLAAKDRRAGFHKSDWMLLPKLLLKADLGPGQPENRLHPP